MEIRKEKAMKEKNEKLSGEVSQEQIEMWKKLHRAVFQIIVGDKICYLKRPNRATMKIAMDLGEKDPLRFNEILLENCWLGGDAEIKTNDDYFLEAIGELGALVDFGRAELKKL